MAPKTNTGDLPGGVARTGSRDQYAPGNIVWLACNSLPDQATGDRLLPPNSTVIWFPEPPGGRA